MRFIVVLQIVCLVKVDQTHLCHVSSGSRISSSRHCTLDRKCREYTRNASRSTTRSYSLVPRILLFLPDKYLSLVPRVPLFFTPPGRNDQVSDLTGAEACRRLLALRSAAKSTPATPLVGTSSTTATAAGQAEAASTSLVAGREEKIHSRRTVSSARHLAEHVVVLGFPARCVVCWWLVWSWSFCLW